MPDEPSKSTSSPSEHLAGLICAKLSDANLITTAKAGEVLAKLVSGTASQEDWKLWLELPTATGEEVSQ